MVIAPRGETEHVVAALWAEVRGTCPASIDDEFLAVGGDPAQARRLLARVHERWGVRISYEEFTAASSIAGLAAAVERKRAEARTRENGLIMSALAELDALGPTLRLE
jgi:hypothetical protein